MKILVTGGAGFIGSNLVDALVAQGHEILVIDNLSSGQKEHLNQKAKLYEADVSHQDISKIFETEKPEVIFHLAAQIDINKSVADPIWDAQQNILASINLLENAKKFGVKKFIFTSSAGVYGDNGIIPTPEDSPLLAPSPYGTGKLATERYLDFYYKTFGLPYVALRLSNAYGPRQKSRSGGAVIAIFCEKAVNGESGVIEGTGEQTRDYIFIDDIISAKLAALSSDKVGVYNIATNKEVSIKQIAETIKKLTDGKIDFVHGPARSVDQQRSALDYSRAKNELGWEPKVSLEQGLAKTLEWFKSKKKS
jgi:UDP-glucose 4-epimerase